MDNEGLVVRVSLLNKRQRRRIKAFFSGLDTAAVVDDEAEAEGHVFMLEDRYLLLYRILQKRKTLFNEIAYRTVLLVGNTDVQFGKVDIHIELKSRIILSMGGDDQQERQCRKHR